MDGLHLHRFVGAAAIDRWNFRTHRPQVCRQLASKVDRVHVHEIWRPGTRDAIACLALVTLLLLLVLIKNALDLAYILRLRECQHHQDAGVRGKHTFDGDDGK